MARKYAVSVVVVTLLCLSILFAQDEVFRFVAVGDTGCGCSGQEKVSNRMLQWHQTNPYSLVVMLGDNIYGGLFGKRGGHKDLFSERFDKHYAALMSKDVRFYATLGNHDYETRNGADEIADKKRFNILGPKGYYAFESNNTIDGKPLIIFISLNSVELIKRDRSDKTQIAWLSKTLTETKAIWKVIYFHHPLYAPSGEGHEPELDLRRDLEDIFVAAGVQLVLTGHNHYYARMKTQRGVTHFISGGGGRKLKEPIQNANTVRVAEIYHFLYFEVYPDKMTYTLVPAEGNYTDSGSISPTPPDGGNPASTTP